MQNNVSETFILCWHDRSAKSSLLDLRLQVKNEVDDKNGEARWKTNNAQIRELVDF